MHLDENLLWILDSPSEKAWDEKENEKRISFIHALGLKCDSVGWSNLNLSDPGSEDILSQIELFCDKNGWKARGCYSRGYHINDCQWYRLVGDEFKSTEISDTAEILKDQRGKEYRLDQIKAHSLAGIMPKESYGKQCVSEDFLKVCAEKQLNGLKYCWLRDTGKYRGTQYFAITPDARVPRIMCGKGLSYSVWNTNQLKLLPKYRIIQKLGGSLPKIAQIFTTLDIQLDNCYLKEDMPDTYFAYGYYSSNLNSVSGNDILLRRDAAEKLVSCKVLSERRLRPVYLADRIIPGYSLKKTHERPFPTDDVLKNRMTAYYELAGQARPEKVITEKDALRILRNAKNERNEDFHNPLPKKQRESLRGTTYAALEPYYSVCESGYLSDEYRLLSYQESINAGRDAAVYLEKEEMKSFAADGIVIAVCGNGDNVMLTSSNEVIRISHEEPEIIGQWSSLACFIAEAVL